MDELQRDVAAMFCVGFDGPAITVEMRQLIEGGVGGVILFARNIESPAQAAALCRQLQSLAPRPLLIAIDQEGGHVQRIGPPLTVIPPMRQVGQRGDVAEARQIGQTLGRELRALGININFAPVLDVDTNPANPIIGDRSFGRTPHVVAEMGCTLIEAMQAEGVAASGKHFPGHGDTEHDSHLDLPRLRHGLARLERVELPPFAAAVRCGVASIMTAHVIFEAIDAKYPATMSRPALDGILRDRLGFDGVVFSDDLEMKAIADHFGLEEAVVRGVHAGVDVMLVCRQPELQRRAIESLAAAVKRGQVSPARIAEARRRIDRLRTRYALQQTAPPGV